MPLSWVIPQVSACTRIPYLDQSVKSSAGKLLTIGVPGEVLNRFAVALQREESLPGSHIPYPNGLVPAGGGESLAVR